MKIFQIILAVIICGFVLAFAQYNTKDREKIDFTYWKEVFAVMVIITVILVMNDII